MLMLEGNVNAVWNADTQTKELVVSNCLLIKLQKHIQLHW